VAIPDHLNPFVLPVEAVAPERHGQVDLYLPLAMEPRPAIVLVHGGPLPSDLSPTPRNWPVYRGYASHAVARGVVGVTVDHRLHDIADYPAAAANVAAAVDTTRTDARVDADRIAIWFFSGGGLLLADWLMVPPSWLRCVAASYPLLAPLSGWAVDPRFRPAEAVDRAGTLPVVLTRAGRERAPITETVDAFVKAARRSHVQLQIIDVPNGHHGFDVRDHTDESRRAVTMAFDAILARLL
jgi:acetyl esterase/lipase